MFSFKVVINDGNGGYRHRADDFFVFATFRVAAIQRAPDRSERCERAPAKRRSFFRPHARSAWHSTPTHARIDGARARSLSNFSVTKKKLELLQIVFDSSSVQSRFKIKFQKQIV